MTELVLFYHLFLNFCTFVFLYRNNYQMEGGTWQLCIDNISPNDSTVNSKKFASVSRAAKAAAAFNVEEKLDSPEM